MDAAGDAAAAEAGDAAVAEATVAAGDTAAEAVGGSPGLGPPPLDSAPAPSPEPSPARTSSWAETLTRSSPHGFEVKFANRPHKITDELLIEWADWARQHLERRLGGEKILRFDISQQAVGDAGIRAVVDTLLDLGVDVEDWRLHSNKLGQGAADALADFIRRCFQPVKQLHLSHNELEHGGMVNILRAVAEAESQVVKGPKYPVPSNSRDPLQALPLWLRLEYNPGQVSAGFVKQMQEDMLTLRRAAGFLPAARKASMICEALEGQQCKSGVCKMLLPMDLGNGRTDEVAGPVVHLPWMGRRGGYGESPAYGDRPAAAGAHRRPGGYGDSPVYGGVAGEGRRGDASPSSPSRRGADAGACRDFQHDRCMRGSACRYRHVESERGVSAGMSAAALAAERRLREQVESGAEIGLEPGRGNRRARVALSVEGPPAAWAPDNFLFPLCPGDVVEVLFYPEEVEDPEWLWARRLEAIGELAEGGVTVGIQEGFVAVAQLVARDLR